MPKLTARNGCNVKAVLNGFTQTARSPMDIPTCPRNSSKTQNADGSTFAPIAVERKQVPTLPSIPRTASLIPQMMNMSLRKKTLTIVRMIPKKPMTSTRCWRPSLLSLRRKRLMLNRRSLRDSRRERARMIRSRVSPLKRQTSPQPIRPRTKLCLSLRMKPLHSWKQEIRLQLEVGSHL